ncbi:NHLP leader peptide family RiPP precursor [Paenibacillus glycanilyticus]|uniref:NHLP leader peptide family RiPP precursor n=1 Tax=Paenibacillus glycanilyticus TaxID=126569 RepID=UPI000FDCABDD|nr:NHLP leader peptide family RiPP precursor [Paenibacillus glycanilyticus]
MQNIALKQTPAPFVLFDKFETPNARTTSPQAIRNQIIQKVWEDEAFKQQFIANPKLAVKEAFGIELPTTAQIKVVEESSDEYFFVIPPKPSEMKKQDVKEIPAW